MNPQPLSLFSTRFRDPFLVPSGDFARRGLVDREFVERSVEIMRNQPDAEKRLCKELKEQMESIRAIDLVYGDELNEWAATTRERLWLEHFTAEAILRRLKSPPSTSEVKL